jgi:hypothetical protein
MAMTVGNIEAAGRLAANAEAPATPEKELPIESHLAISAYRGGGSGSH